MKDLAERFAELRNAIMRLSGNPSCDDPRRAPPSASPSRTHLDEREGQPRRCRHRHHGRQRRRPLTTRAALAGRCPRTLRPASTNVQERLRKAKRRATRPREKRVPSGRCLNPIKRRCQTIAFHHLDRVQRHPFQSRQHRRCQSRLRRTASRRRRAAGRGRSAGPRDPRGSRLPDLYRGGRLNRERGGLGEV